MLDIKHLLTMTGGDIGLADEVLDIFRSQSETWGRLLQADLPQQQWADAAHTLKGAALSIGAHAFAEKCAEVERIGRGKPVGKTAAATYLSELKSDLNQVLEACAWASHELSKSGLRSSNTPNS